MFKTFLMLLVLMSLVSAVSANTFRVTNNNSIYTIIYSDFDGYTEVRTMVAYINELRRMYSEQRISKYALIEGINCAIKELRKTKGIKIY